MTQEDATIFVGVLLTAGQIVSAIIHFYEERSTRRVAQRAVEKIVEAKIVAEDTNTVAKDAVVKMEEVKTLVKNGHNGDVK